MKAVITKTAGELCDIAVQSEFDSIRPARRGETYTPYCIALSDRVHHLHALRRNPLRPGWINVMLSSNDSDTWHYFAIREAEALQILD